MQSPTAARLNANTATCIGPATHNDVNTEKRAPFENESRFALVRSSWRSFRDYLGAVRQKQLCVQHTRSKNKNQVWPSSPVS